jgi:hypothetical protein
MSTRISDLPDIPSNIKSERGLGEFSGQNSYIPINTHPNPYMNNSGQGMHGGNRNGPYQEDLSFEHKEMIANMPATRLPSRDIPIDPSKYIQDEQIVPNYIPPIKDLNDYVKDHEFITETLQTHQSKKTRGQIIDAFISEIQTPFAIALLYYVFQLPVINNLLFKRITFITIYREDGNLNMNGMLLKSLMFGALYYGVLQIYNLVSSSE